MLQPQFFTGIIGHTNTQAGYLSKIEEDGGYGSEKISPGSGNRSPQSAPSRHAPGFDQVERLRCSFLAVGLERGESVPDRSQ